MGKNVPVNSELLRDCCSRSKTLSRNDIPLFNPLCKFNIRL